MNTGLPPTTSSLRSPFMDPIRYERLGLCWGAVVAGRHFTVDGKALATGERDEMVRLHALERERLLLEHSTSLRPVHLRDDAPSHGVPQPLV